MACAVVNIIDYLAKVYGRGNKCNNVFNSLMRMNFITPMPIPVIYPKHTGMGPNIYRY